MSVIEFLKKHHPDLIDPPHYEWRVFGPSSLDDTHTYVIFYDKYGREQRAFEISIDGQVEETTGARTISKVGRGKRKQG